MSAASTTGTVTIIPVGGIPEVREGDDLTAVIGLGLSASGVVLRDGDVVVVSSKIASKALGLVTDDPDKDRVVAGETEYVVAERSVPGRVTRVVRSKAGPIMAAAGVDGSNTGDRGGWLLLPHDPDGVCERLHDGLTKRYGVRLGVVLSDTSARPWRLGHSDFALGAHGLRVVDDLRGTADADGRELSVTTRAVADEIAAAADLAKGKTVAVPVAVVRGLATLLVDGDPRRHPRGRDLVRTGPHDWFGHGRVEAVRAALGVVPGSDESVAVGIPPSEPGQDRLEAVGRAVRLALHGLESGTADIGRVSVTLGAATPFELGSLSARLQVALWSEWLEGSAGPPSADGASLIVAITARSTR
ncbi:MAG: coenzyme F420-0:L-glutamate ligase [Terracoccus sp.]